MAGTAAPGRLSPAPGRVRFDIAGPADEPDLRRLLRQTPLGGGYRLTLEREPDALAADFGLAGAATYVIARDRDSGAAIGMCERVVRLAHVDGAVRRLPYLAALRVHPDARGRIAILRGGFAALRAVEQPDDAPFALTSITADNHAARRLLTAGIDGLPLYRPVGDFLTFALRPRRCRPRAAIASACLDDLPALTAFLDRHNRRRQFAPHWRDDDLARLADAGLPPHRILLARVDGEIRGSIALWDQRAHRQTVMRGYPPVIAALRPALNRLAPLLRLPTLPPLGEPLAQAVAALHAAEADDAELALDLVAAALTEAARLRFSVVILGLATDHPWCAPLKRRYGGLTYRTSLYLAHWPEAREAVAALGPALPAPELGFL